MGATSLPPPSSSSGRNVLLLLGSLSLEALISFPMAALQPQHRGLDIFLSSDLDVKEGWKSVLQTYPE